jgi:multidrug efflux pump subunit AcrA (membrane-fusion protein)
MSPAFTEAQSTTCAPTSGRPFKRKKNHEHIVHESPHAGAAGGAGPLAALFVYVALRSGPLTPIPVTVTGVKTRSITPALFGIGTIEARYTYKIGPTVAGRVRRVDVQVGDRVRAGQLLGEMVPVDFDDRIASLTAGLKRAEAAALTVKSQVLEALARKTYADEPTAPLDSESALAVVRISQSNGRPI